MAGAKIFSIEGKGLKLTTAEDIEPHIQDLKSNNDVEEIKFLGNTLGIGASEALAKVLESKKNLQVYFQPRSPAMRHQRERVTDTIPRSQTSPTSSPHVSSLRSHPRCPTSSPPSLPYQISTLSISPTTHSASTPLPRS
jgi:hypothetical protein